MDHPQAPTKRVIHFLKGVVSFFWFAIFFAAVHGASAASLYLSPSSVSAYSGQSFSVSVYVSSPDQAMNAAQAEISFPIDKLSVVSLSKTGSIINLWVQEPSFSNQDGAIDLQGVVVNPGFVGSAGKLLTVTFRAKQTGTAKLSFVSGSVLANDGKGTNITNTMTGSSVSAQTPAPGVPAVGQTGIVFNPLITSTPPTADGVWLKSDDIAFSWQVPVDAATMNYDISSNPDYQMPIIERPLVTSTAYDLTQFADGAWYFFLSFKRAGEWTSAAVKHFALDRTPPEPFTITRTDTDLTNPEPRFKWNAVDQASGVSRYEVKIGDGDWFNAASIMRGSFYILPPQLPADARTLTVRAYDAAGNFRASTVIFTVRPAGWNMWSSRFSEFVSSWGWIVLIAVLLLAGWLGYELLHALMVWRRSMLSEMAGIKEELREDVARLEAKMKRKGMAPDDVDDDHDRPISGLLPPGK